ncbi:MAG: acyloxyacyl hydrolase [Trichloromonadaceae bacterium]
MKFTSDNETGHVPGVSSATWPAGALGRLALAGLVLCLLAPKLSGAEDLRLLSIGMRARVTESTVLGQPQPESFQEYAAMVNIGLPWERYSLSGWGVGTRLMGSAGVLRGAGETALVASLIPMLAFGSQDGRFTLDMGAGGALLSRDRFGTQDYGGPFQFALTLGAGFPLYQRLGVGYRFLHYSDAAIHGSNNTGADFHMIEFIYRFSD